MKVSRALQRIPSGASAPPSFASRGWGSGAGRFAIQRVTDPSPPPDLDLEKLPPHPNGGEPIPDEGEAIAALQGEGEAPVESKRPEAEEPGSPVQASHDGPVPGGVDAARVSAGLGEGRPLDGPARERVGAFFGHDFSRVRIHADAPADRAARSLNALAFTVGDHVAFASGRYEPGTPAGQRLIAHELTHVVQQAHGLGPEVLRAGIGAPGDRYEVEADQNAERFARGDRAAISGTGGGGGGPALQLAYSGSAAAAYAKSWALSTNPKYPRFPNDCTNFVSQAVLAGGWTMAGGSCGDRKSNSAWWYGDWTCAYPGVRASYTWAGAENFYQFTSASGRGKVAANVSDLDVGDVLQMAFSGSHVGHSMVVTGKKDGNIFLSYHTSDHLDRPFWGSGGILEAYPSANYYGWNL